MEPTIIMGFSQLLSTVIIVSFIWWLERKWELYYDDHEKRINSLEQNSVTREELEQRITTFTREMIANVRRELDEVRRG